MAGSKRVHRPPAVSGTAGEFGDQWLPIAVRIAYQRPVSEWRDALADLPESEREPVRGHLMRFHEGRKERARLDAEIESGRVVWMHIRCGEAL